MGKHGKSMKTIKGPAVFLAQFVDKQAPFNSLEGMCQWAADLGYKGIQIPTWESFLIDLDKAAESQTYCDELKGKINSYGLEITELSTHLQGQLVAVHPAYDLMFDNFAPDAYKNNPKARTQWAIETLKKAAKASNRLGLNAHATFSGALLWHTWHPWPQRPDGLVEMGFKELADRWLPILNTFDENGVDVLSKTFSEVGGYDDLVLLKDIQFNSFCEHHMIPFIGKAHVAYLPSNRVVGISKIARLVDIYAQRLQTQETMTAEIANALSQSLNPRGVAIILDAEHMCMSLRGVKKDQVSTITTRFTGEFETNEALRDRFMKLTNN